MGIRLPTSHAKCDVCVRHKLLIRKLSADRNALQAQMRQYAYHLKRQYEDRVLYWGSRSLSRMAGLGSDGVQTLVLICDGMDHAKFRYPRSLSMVSKAFDNFIRPHLNMHAVILHGKMALLATSESWLPKDSNFCVELVAHVLHTISAAEIDGCRTDLRSCRVVLQSDNTCRELKNNGLLRFLGQLVGSKKLYSAELRCLRKGHTHEDIDAFFASVACAIEACQDVHLPSDFSQLLSDYLATARKHEPLKKVCQVDAARDWSLGEVKRCLSFSQ